MGLKIVGMATMKNMNVRKDGPAGELQLAVDLKLVVDLDARQLDQLVGEKESVYESLYDKKNGVPKFQAVEDLVFFDSEFKDHEITIDALEKSFHTTKIDKFSTHLRINNVVSLTFRVQIHPKKRLD